MYCNNTEDLSIICFGCMRNLDINGNFKAIGGEESKIREELCEDYEKLKVEIRNMSKFYHKIKESKKMVI